AKINDKIISPIEFVKSQHNSNNNNASSPLYDIMIRSALSYLSDDKEKDSSHKDIFNMHLKLIEKFIQQASSPEEVLNIIKNVRILVKSQSLLMPLSSVACLILILKLPINDLNKWKRKFAKKR